MSSMITNSKPGFRPDAIIVNADNDSKSSLDIRKSIMSDMRMEARAYNKHFSNRYLKNKNFHQLLALVHPSTRGNYEDRHAKMMKKLEAEQIEKSKEIISNLKEGE